MAPARLYLVFLTSFLSFSSAASNPSVLDSTNNITYQGISNNGVESFLNIPFGEDVDGTKRFTRPVAKIVIPGSTVDASKPGPACPQQKVPIPIFPFFSNVTDVSENCLNLRVDRVANSSTDALLPVMVYIYGGGYALGQAYDELYTPTGLLLGAAAKRTPVIYVAMNYRVNIFGFAASDALSTEQNTNVGMLDQMLALQWVKDNIKAFGGDPDDVTIFGESAGGTSVGLQITAYGGQGPKGLFHKAIMQSGGPLSAGITSNASQTGTAAIAKSLGCPSSPSTSTLRCLRSTPLADLLNATIAYELESNPPFGFGPFQPYIDGKFLPAAPSELVSQGRFQKDVAIMIGWNQNDASLFTSPTIQNETEVEATLADRGLKKPAIAKTLALYPASEFMTQNNASASYYRASRIGRDIDGTCQAFFFAQAVSRQSPSIAKNVYLYQLDQTPLAALLKSVGSSYYGIPHFSDIFYVFNTLAAIKDKIGATDADVALASRISGSWAAFAALAVPGSVKGRAANATLGRWVPAFPQKGGVSVFAIGGSQEGNVLIDDNTTHAGLDDMLNRCAYLNSKQIFKQVGT